MVDSVLLANEQLGHRVVEKLDQRIVEAGHVQQPAGLLVDAELRPGDRLEELLVGAEAARQRHERVGEVGHHRLALVHRADDVQPGEALMRDLAHGERVRDDADHLAAGVQHRVGDRRPSGRRGRRRRRASSYGRRSPGPSPGPRRSKRDYPLARSRRRHRCVACDPILPCRRGVQAYHADRGRTFLRAAFERIRRDVPRGTFDGCFRVFVRRRHQRAWPGRAVAGVRCRQRRTDAARGLLREGDCRRSRRGAQPRRAPNGDVYVSVRTGARVPASRRSRGS